MNILKRAPLENSTYERDGKWYSHVVIDSSSAIERPATAEEIEAAGAKPPVETPKAAKAAPKPKAKAKK